MVDARRYLQGQIVDGQFPLLQYVGGTGQSSVFLTECAETEDRKAAIKLIAAPPGRAEARLTRWRLAARFSHPHLLRLFHMGRCTLDNASLLYVVMEYGDENLAQILSKRPLSPTETHDMLGAALGALSYIHGKGFVHGHVQPSNIMAVGDHVKLSSDGVCRIGELGERHGGHDPYRAPEQAAGDPSPASDVWSLGMTLVESLTLRLPDREAERGTMSLPRELPAPFLEIARRCLNNTPKRRWSVSDLKASVERSLPDAQETAAPAPRMKPSPRRRPLALTALSIAAVMILVAMAVDHFNSNPQQTHAASIESFAERPSLPPAREPDASEAAPRPSKPESAEVKKPAGVAPASPAALPSSPAGSRLPGGVRHRELPDVPRYASDTIWGTVRVRVRVQVDPSGNVVQAGFDSRGPSRYFARLSIDAARQWKFNPPDVNAQNVPSEWAIDFDYTKAETTATAVEQDP